MFGLGFGEIVIVAILALVLLGPDQLPEAAKALGKTLQDLKKATDGLKGQLEAEMYSVEKAVKKAIDGDRGRRRPPRCRRWPRRPRHGPRGPPPPPRSRTCPASTPR